MAPQLRQVLIGHPGPMVTYAQYDPPSLANGMDLDRLTWRVEAQGIAHRLSTARSISVGQPCRVSPGWPPGVFPAPGR